MKSNNIELEKLEEELKKAKESNDDSLVIQRLTEIIYYHQGNQNILEFLDRVLEILSYHQKNGNRLGEINAHISAAEAYNALGDYHQSIEFCEKILNLLNTSGGDDLLFAKTYGYLGNNYRMIGDYQKTLDYLFQAIKIYKENMQSLNLPQNTFFKRSFAHTLESVAITCGSLDQKDRCREHLHQALQIYKEIDNAHGIAKVLNNLGVSFSEEDSQKTIEYYQEALQIASENNFESMAIGFTNNIGGVYEDMKEYEQALQYYHQALERANATSLHKYSSFLLKHIGTIHLKQKSYDLALHYLNKSLDLFQQNKQQDEVKDVYHLLSQTYREKQDYKRALEYLDDFIKLKDDIFNIEKNKQITEMQTKYEVEKKEREAEIYRLKNVELVEKNEFIIQQKEELEIHREELRLQNEQLSETLDELQRTQEQLVESRKMAALDGLVAGVAHEINTPVGVMITAVSSIKSKTTSFIKQFETEEITFEDLEEYLQHTYQTTNLVMENLNRTDHLIQNFKQVAVDPTKTHKRIFQLYPYLDSVFKMMDFQTLPISVHLNCPAELELNSYPHIFVQILTTLVENSLIHGFDSCDSGQITIDAILEENQLHFRYQDDGVGIDEDLLPRVFDPFVTSNKQKGAGLGLHIVYNLVTQVLHGTIQAQRSKKGVIFEMMIPS